MDVVGEIRFDRYILDVYNSLDEPYFLASDVAAFVDYSAGRVNVMLGLLEDDEYLLVPIQRQGQRIKVQMLTELGLYNILSQSNKDVARKWRRVVHSNLIIMRKQRDILIDGQFEDWDAIADTLFIDPDTGILMEFRTVQGGDVQVFEYEEQ